MPRGAEAYKRSTGPFMLLQGPPASGKTTAMAALVRAGYRVHLIDVGKQAASLIDALSDLSEEYVAAHFWWVQPVEDVELSDSSTLRSASDANRTWRNIKRLQQRWTDGDEKAPFWPKDAAASAESRAYWNNGAVVALDCITDLIPFAYVEGRLRDKDRSRGGAPDLSTWLGGLSDITPASRVLLDMLRTWKYLCNPRPFTVIVTAHTNTVKVRMRKGLTDVELARIAEDEKQIEAILGADWNAQKRVMSMTVESAHQFPMGIQRTDAKTIPGLFDLILGTHQDETTDTRFVYTRDHPTLVVTRGCDLYETMPARLPTTEALPAVLRRWFGRDPETPGAAPLTEAPPA